MKKKINKLNLSLSDKAIDHYLKFDPEDPKTFLKSSSPQPAMLATRTLPAIPWPTGKKPTPKPLSKKPTKSDPLPQADILVVTWTVAEALALSDVLTPGYRSKTDWYTYASNWAKFKPLFQGGAPALEQGCLGLYFPTQIGSKKVLCVKSNLHLARDGSKMPIKDLWLQMIAEVKPSLVITTGTAGGIGSTMILGDVVVTKKVRFDCQKTFKNASFAQQQFICTKNVSTANVSSANQKMMSLIADKLPVPAIKRSPKIILQPLKTTMKIDVVTTDFFAYDNTTNTFGLQTIGSAVEMGDAVLGLACSQLSSAPAWIAVRNASDPQIDGTLSVKDQIAMAGRIYEKYGYWTTVNSAIACWALIA